MTGRAPSTVAVIPARGGSKGVPRKNLRRVGGVPLVARAVTSARAATAVDLVIVSTDDPEIAAVAQEWGAEVVERPAELSGDLASSESAVLHTLDALEARGIRPDVVVLLQATSPFVDPADLDRAVLRVVSGECDVAFSAIETWGFLWRSGADGLVGVNHDPRSRPRRQDRTPDYLETGAFYALRSEGLRAAGHRFFGTIVPVVVRETGAIEIDTDDHLAMARSLASLSGPPVRLDVDALVTDFDGVHTDDTVTVGADGSEYVTVSRSDGMGVALLREVGVPVLILSTETNPVVQARASKLGVEVLQAQTDKAAALSRWVADRGLHLDRVAYLGNDVNDLSCLELVGWPIAVPHAHPRVLAAARLVLGSGGGNGAVRELADLVLNAREERSAGARRAKRRRTA